MSALAGKTVVLINGQSIPLIRSNVATKEVPSCRKGLGDCFPDLFYGLGEIILCRSLHYQTGPLFILVTMPL